MKKVCLIIMSCSMYMFSYAQNVNIPDSNFKNALINHVPIIDVNNDDEIQVSEALNTLYINVNSKSITDLTGIESFTNLRELYCAVNEINNIDISSNLMLVKLKVGSNPINSIDVTKNLDLEDFSCAFTNVSNVNLENNIHLYDIDIRGTLIESINLSQNHDLLFFDGGNSKIESIDFSNNFNLSILVMDNIDTLICFNLLNGNSSIFSGGSQTFTTNSGAEAHFTPYFSSINCPNLSAVFVQDVNYAINNLTNITSSSVFSYNNLGCSSLSLDNFNIKESIVIYPNPAIEYFEFENYNTIELQFLEIYNSQGILIDNFSSNFQKINIKYYTPGLYFLKLKTNMGLFNMRLIKE